MLIFQLKLTIVNSQLIRTNQKGYFLPKKTVFTIADIEFIKFSIHQKTIICKNAKKIQKTTRSLNLEYLFIFFCQLLFCRHLKKVVLVKVNAKF